MTSSLYMSFLVSMEVGGGAAFDHVAGEGEGCAAEADDAQLVLIAGVVCTRGGEVGGYFFDGAGYID